MKNIKLKTLIVIMILFAMLMEVVSPISTVFANELDGKEETGDDTQVVFRTEWIGDTQELEVNAGSSTSAKFVLTLSGISTGFNKLKINVIDESDSSTPVTNIDIISPNRGNQYVDTEAITSNSQLNFKDNIDSGKDISGMVKFNFGETNNFTQYNKTYKIVLTGERKNYITDEIVEIYKETTLNVTVNPVAIVDSFSGTSSVELKKSSRDFKYAHSNGEYEVSAINETYQLTLEAHNAEYANYDLILSRVCGDDSIAASSLNSSENLVVDTSLVPEYLNPTVTRNADGTTKISISTGEKHTEYSNTTLFDIKDNVTIKVKYKIIEDTSRGSSGTGSTVVTYQANSDIQGYTKTSNVDGTTYEQKKYTNTFKNENSYALCYFVGDYLANSEIRAGTYSKEELDSYIESGKIEFKYVTDLLYWDRRPENEKENLKIYNYDFTESDNSLMGKDVSTKKANLTYKDGEGTTKSLILNQGEMTVKSINVTSLPGEVAKIDFYKRDGTLIFTATRDNLSFTAEEGDNISEYYAILDKAYCVTNNTYPSWNTSWNIDVQKLKDRGLSDAELGTIKSVTRYQEGLFGTSNCTSVGSATYYLYTATSTKVQTSYMELDIGSNFNATMADGARSLQMKIKMCKNDEVFRNSLNEVVVNQNPTIYIKLPTDFIYNITSVNIGYPGGMTVDSYTYPYIKNGERFLKIDLKGTYNSDYIKETNIYVNYNRKNSRTITGGNKYVEAYMLTDNANYFTGNVRNNNYNLEHKGEILNSLFYTNKQYTVTANSVIELSSGIYSQNMSYMDSAISNGNATKNNPYILQSGNTVKLGSRLRNRNQVINNIKMISRLPFAGNTAITGDKNDVGSTITLTGLNNIVVRKINSNTSFSQVDKSKYTIYYSEKETADFTTAIGTDAATSYVKYVSQTEASESGGTLTASDVSNAKTFIVVFSDDYSIKDKETLIVDYEMTMPDAEGIAGGIGAVSYRKEGDLVPNILEPNAAYVQKGNPNGTLTIAKTYEGRQTDVQLQNIEFKVTDLEGNVLITPETTSEGIAKTNSEGKIVLTEVPEGEYLVKEITNIDGWTPDVSEKYVNIENAEQVTCSYLNRIIRFSLTIKKEWKDTSIQQGNATFQITRNNSDGINCIQTITTDKETGYGIAYGIPRGTYTIKEINNTLGWTLGSIEPTDSNTVITGDTLATKVIAVDGDEHITAGNIPGTATLVIDKTVPTGDKVEGLKFHVKGTPVLNYKKSNGEIIDLKLEKTIEVGVEQADVEFDMISEQHAKIYIKNVPLGQYSIEEIEMPSIEVNGVSQDRYLAVRKLINVNTANIESVVTIENTWKKGTLKIVKTAEEGVELEQFQVRVTGTSYYGTQVDRILGFDKQGIATLKVDIGNYVVEEIENNAFKPYYIVKENGAKIRKNEPQTYEIQYGKTTTAEIFNENVTGYVKIQKKLEGRESDGSAAKGIKFKLEGLSLTGEAVEEIITIGNDGTGTSGPIPAGGEYVINEMEETIPDYYEMTEEIPVSITKNNTETNPLVLNITDNKAKGNLNIATKTIPEGGPLSPIVYTVTPISINADGSYNKSSGETVINADTVGCAELNNISAGMYLVEQTSIPVGWKKDAPQIIEVPEYNTGFVVFEITKEIELANTEVIFNKEVLNSQDTKASIDDFVNAKIREDESFEVKIKNKQTQTVYFVFINQTEQTKITGLPAGEYEIEEMYKPKYTTNNYYLKNGEIFEKMEQSENKYSFEIPESSDKISVEIKVENKINTEFGFGGQVHKDNLSKITSETQGGDVGGTTRAIFYVVDESNEAIPGAVFKIVDSQGRDVQLSTNGSTFESNNRRLIIKGLTPGNYTLVNVSVPAGYLQPENETFTVYSNAVRTVRTEVQRNIPRGSLTLSTTYTTEKGATRNVSRSKYKIVDKVTGEVLLFSKKPNGTYVKSNLDTAIDTISIKAGKVQVSGIEVGTYQVGLVDVTTGYGIVKDTVEEINIEKDQTQEINVEVEKKEIVQTLVSDYDAAVLDSEGKMWIWNNGIKYPTCINSQENQPLYGIKIKKIAIGDDLYGALDENGGVWLVNESGNAEKVIEDNIVNISVDNGKFAAIDSEGKLWKGGRVEETVCLSTATENSIISDVKMEKVCIGSNGIVLLDDLGRIWTCVDYSGSSIAGYPSSKEDTFKCISTIVGTPLNNSYSEGTKVIDIVLDHYSYEVAALDSNGKIWTWGYNYSGCLGTGNSSSVVSPICINDIPENGIQEVNFVQVRMGYYSAVALDSDGKVWTWGSNDYGQLGDNRQQSNSLTPICISDIETSPINGIQIKDISLKYYTVFAVDTTGKLYGWGYNNNGSLICDSYNSVYNYYEPTQVQYKSFVYNNTFEYNKQFTKVESKSFAIDNKGKIWAWGTDNYYGTQGNGTKEGSIKPKRIFVRDDVWIVDIVRAGNNTIALDSNGKVWTTGSEYWNGTLGTGDGTTTLNWICISELDNNPLALAYESGIKISKINASQYVVTAIDTEGKIWTWGYNNNYIGVEENSNNNRLPVCLSDIEGTELAEKNIKMVQISCYYSCVGIDSEGKIWTWGNSDTRGFERGDSSSCSPVCVSDIDENSLNTAYKGGTKFVNVSMCDYRAYLIDDTGKVWMFSTDITNAVCLSTLADTKWKELFTENVLFVKAVGTQLLDNTGKVWNSKDVDGNKIPVLTLISKPESDFRKIKMIDISYDSALDENGEIWIYGQNNGNGVKHDEDNPYNLFSDAKNAIYNKKMIKIKDYEYLIDEDGKSWNVRNLEEDSICRVEALQKKGIEIVKYLESTSQVIALDSDGKLWICGNDSYENSKEFTCLSDIEGTELNTAYNAGVRIVNYYGNIASLIALDSQGNLWALGYNNYGQLGTGNNDKVNKIQKIEFESNVKIEEILEFTDSYAIAKDTEGNLWSWGYNDDGQLGIGTSENTNVPTMIQLGEGAKFKELLKVQDNAIYIKDTDNYVWAWGNNDSGNIGNGTSLDKVTSPYRWNIKVDKFFIKGSKGYSDGYFGTKIVFAIDENGDVWACGYNGWGQLGVNNTNMRQNQLTLVSGYNNMPKIEKITVSGTSTFAIDENGDLWVWGDNYFGELGYKTDMHIQYSDPYYAYRCVKAPVCSTKTLGNKFYDKKIIDVKTLSGGELGYGMTLVITEENEAYLVGLGFNTGYGYRENDVEYPIPKLLLSDYSNVSDIIHVGSYSYGTAAIIVKFNDNTYKIYRYVSNSTTNIIYFSNIYTEVISLLEGCNITSINEFYNIVARGYYVKDGKLYTWKSDLYRYSGNDADYVPKEQIMFGNNIIDAYKSGDSYMMVVTSDGEAYCVGNKSYFDFYLDDSNSTKWETPISLTEQENRSESVLSHGWYINQNTL